MIPKIIHYCWFGGNPLPESAQKCIASWKKYCPDYEIKQWDESNFDVNACAYTQEAYKAKKWAFVSDYARFQILYQYGGLYFDTDVELIKPIEKIVSAGGFLACEQDPDGEKQIVVASGLGMGAEPKFPLYAEIMQGYEKRHFTDENGNFNGITIVKYVTDILLEKGLQQKAEIQRVAGITVYPKEYFCPKDWFSGKTVITPKTISVHHYDGSWGTPENNLFMLLQQRLRKVMPSKFAIRFALLFSRLRYRGIKNMFEK